MESAKRGSGLATAALALAAVAAQATSIVPPENLGDLARTSEAVVLARADAPRVSRRGPLLFTLTPFHAIEPVSGPLTRGARFTVEAPGGELEGTGWVVPGSPRFVPGTVYLLFLSARPTGEWLPKTMAYGVLRRIPGRDGSPLLAPLPEGSDIRPFLRTDGILPEPVETYVESALLSHLRAVIGGRTPWDARAVLARGAQVPFETHARAIPAGCSLMGDGTYNLRWKVFDTGGYAPLSADATGDGSLAGGGFTEVQGALSDWNGIADTNLDLRYGGAMSYTMPCTGEQDYPAPSVKIVIFNDPCSDIADLNDCSGTLGFGGPWYSGTHTFAGATWYTITSWFLVLNNGAGCLGRTAYQLMVEHELGHGLGFDHVSDPRALMYTCCCNAIDSTDTRCAQYLYPGSGGAPTPTPTPTPTPPGLAASFTFSPAAPYTLAPVRFTDTSVGATGWLWTFGDGTISTLKEPSHTYRLRGTYTVALRVTDGAAFAQTTRTVRVGARARRHLPDG